MTFCLFFFLLINIFLSTFVQSQPTQTNTNTDPYVLSLLDEVKVIPLLTSGDNVNGYNFVGIPDGMSLIQLEDGSYQLNINHELFSLLKHIPSPLGDLFPDGINRGHDEPGAFVSTFKIHPNGLITSGHDFLQTPSALHLYDTTTESYLDATQLNNSQGIRLGVLNRLCSADSPSTLWYEGKGTKERFHLTGEEESPFGPLPIPLIRILDHGRAFAFIATGEHAGEAWELPYLGQISFENILVSPYPQLKTVALILDDSGVDTSVDNFPVSVEEQLESQLRSPSEVYFYVGEKN